MRTRTNESTNCSFADGDKSANNEHCLHFFKKVKVRTRCTFYKHIENSFFEGWEFLFHDWICANISLLCHLSDWLVGSVQIHCRTGPAACPTAVLSHLESGGRISAEHSADICHFLLSPQQHQIKNSIYRADIQHPDIWLGSSLVQQAAATAGGAATSNKTAAPKARRGRAASGTSDPEGGYTPDIHDVTDGIFKLRKTYNYKNNYIYWNHHGALISNNKK